MKTIAIMCGLPGSGKSVVASRLARDGFQLLCADDIRMALGSEFNPEVEPLVHGMLNTMLVSHLKRGMNIVVDETHTRAVYVYRTVKLAREYGYYVVLYRMDTPLEVCLQRRLAEPKSKDIQPWPDIIKRMKRQLDLDEERILKAVDEVLNMKGY